MEKTMNTMADEATTFGRRMLDLLNRQHQYFTELQKMSQEQRALVRAQQSEDLLHLLARRQKIVEAIGQLHRESAPYRERWPQMKGRLAETERSQIAARLGQLQQMLNAILEHDQQDCQELSAAKQQTATELNQTSRAQAANAYYGSSAGACSSGTAGGGFQVTG